MSALLDSLLVEHDPTSLRDAAGLSAARRAARDAARADGLPGPRAEAWKYTSLRVLERRAFAPSTLMPAFDASSLALPPAPRIVFVNGLHHAGLSDLSSLPAGVALQPLSSVLADGDARDVSFLARRYARSDEAFARINAAMATEGMLLRADAGVRSDTLLHLVLVGAPDDDRAWHLRHLVELRDGAAVSLLEHRIAAGANAHLANEIMHVHLGRGADFRHARVQREADAATVVLRTDAVLAGEARYTRADLELGGALSRHELNVALQGERARLRANGVLLANGRRHLDTRLGIDHVARGTSCELTWRGLGAGRGRAVFHGGIVIREGADGSEAMLSNKNLLLSEGAEIDTQPVLEIHADEVKAAHGATVGRLDPTALFYLRSRGIPLTQATSMLTAAFGREVLGLFDEGGLRESLLGYLEQALLGMETLA